MKITPSARVLKMLGEIQFDEWQCIAELVDNSFDDFAEIRRAGHAWPGGYRVSVTLPRGTVRPREAQIVIADTGQGMNRSHLEKAVRAGWSGNDQFEKLGLFGMGFNVSTARLGRKTRILTTQRGDADWIGVEIDLDNIKDDFEAPDIREPKDSPEEHGTRIEITKLDPDRHGWLSRNAPTLRRKLGQVYGWLLDATDNQLFVNGTIVSPRRLCRWGDDRSMVYNKGKRNEEVIPAYIPINHVLSPASVCLVCGNWQDVGLEECVFCESTLLRERDREVRGWLGIQRYLDRNEFGVDFLRNGRKILMNDKRIFDWADPNDPSSLIATEYPEELVHQGGRIIGEIHIDHVPVNYQKNGFEYSDRTWISMLHFLHGPGPLREQKARALGYPANSSPLGLLFKGYRYTNPGFRNLIPGDEKGPIHAKARDWGRLFHNGDPDYQSDEVWWRQVEAFEKLRSAQAATEDSGGSSNGEASVLDSVVEEALGVHKEAPEEAQDVDFGREAPLSLEARERLYITRSIHNPNLSGTFGHPEFGHLVVDTHLVQQQTLLDDNEKAVPVWLVQKQGATATAYLDVDHGLFRRFGWNFQDALLTELAAFFKYRHESPLSTASIVSMLQESCFPDSAIEPSALGAMAREVFSTLRQRMSDAVSDDPARAYQFLDDDEAVGTESAMITGGSRPAGLIEEDSTFVRFAPDVYLVRLLQGWPEAFMDGHVFGEPYSVLSSAETRRVALARVAEPMADVARLVNVPNPGITRLKRAKLSLELLTESLS